MRYRGIVLLFSVMCAHAMDKEIVSIVHNKNSKQDSFFKESIALYNGCFDMLPLEVQGKIIKNIFNLVVYKDVQLKKHVDQITLEKCGLEIPILLGVKFAHEFFQMQKSCKWKIGGKSFVATELFILPHQEKEVFIRMANHPFLVSGNVMPEDYKVIEEMKNEDIKKGLNLRINYRNKTLDCISNIGLLGLISSCMGSMCLMPFCAVKLMFLTGAGVSSGLSVGAQVGMCCVDEYWVDENHWDLTGIKKVNF